MFKFNKIFLISILTMAGALSAMDGVDDMSAWRSVSSINKAVAEQKAAEQAALEAKRPIEVQKKALEDIMQSVQKIVEPRAEALTKCERFIGKQDDLKKCIDQARWHLSLTPVEYSPLLLSRSDALDDHFDMCLSHTCLSQKCGNYSRSERIFLDHTVKRASLLEEATVAIDKMYESQNAQIRSLELRAQQIKKQLWRDRAKSAACWLGSIGLVAAAVIASRR